MAFNPDIAALAPTPPMGWNSWDCFGSQVNEADVKAHADIMAERLKDVGWEYIVIDIQWYEPLPRPFVDGEEPDGTPDELRWASAANGLREGATLAMDEQGRLLPHPKRFPSAADGKGFAPLAAYVHDKGLKFGIHIMRGVPRMAVQKKLPIDGAGVSADRIADTDDICDWNWDNYGVDLSKPGAQEYYDSIIRLYASWGVDYIKADDINHPFRQDEIEALAKAIAKSERDIVLSLSPGGADPRHLQALRKCANLWRISSDFWDHWQDPRGYYCGLRDQFETCAQWAPHIAPGHWPDADMLPLGRIGKNDARGEERQTAYTPDEQITLMSLWCILRSPLMFGGDLTMLDDFTESLITNREVIAVNQNSAANREVFREDERVAWTAEVPGTTGRYLALFNRGDQPLAVGAEFSDLGFSGKAKVRDLWAREELGTFESRFQIEIPPHGAGLYRLSNET